MEQKIAMESKVEVESKNELDNLSNSSGTDQSVSLMSVSYQSSDIMSISEQSGSSSINEIAGVEDADVLWSNQGKHKIIFSSGYKYCFEKVSNTTEYYHCEL